MLGNDNATNVFEKIPLFNSEEEYTFPTTGTQAQGQLGCEAQLTELQQLGAKARAAYNTWMVELEKYKGINSVLELISPKIFQFNDSRFTLAESMSSAVLEEIEKVCDITQKEALVPVIQPLMVREVGVATPKYVIYCNDMLLIGIAAGEIKAAIEPDKQEVVITDKQSTTLSKMETIPLTKVMYQLELYMIIPGGKRIQVEPYIKELLYSRDFEDTSLPIYSVMFVLPQNIMTYIKFHNENINWFININVIPKTTEKNRGEFRIPEVLLKDIQLIPIDPIYNTPQINQADSTSSLPIYPFKIDLVSHKDTTLNSNVKSRVFNNVRLLDVITVLCAELKAEYKKRDNPTDREVKVTISPPDNAKTYEQILIEPGSFTKIINQLQKKYGIYTTGVRVGFDSIKTQLDDMTNTNVTQITILGKGETAPSEGGIKDVIVDLVDPKVINKQMSVTEPFHDSGQYIDEATGTMVLRSFSPYLVLRNNSDGLINGESLRVMNTSTIDHVVSQCDTDNTDIDMQKIYWGKYDNPFNLTQLQDSIRGNKLSVQAEFKDINVLLLSNNQSYRLKFYGEDDLVYTGDYRLKQVNFYYRMGGTVQNGNDVEISAVLSFANVPTLKVNGTEVPRPSYGEKLEASRVIYSGESEAGSTNLISYVGADLSPPAKPDTPPSAAATPSTETPPKFNNVPESNTASSNQNNVYSENYNSGPPYKCIFAGRKDFYGKEFTAEIDGDWKMSNNVKFSNVYDTNFANGYATSSSNELGKTLANNYTFFVNAQRFAKEVIDPCFNIFGTLGENNKVDNWLKLSIGLSQHNIALAVDSTWGSGRGQSLAERFLKIIESSIEYDQVILESNNDEWTFIHIGKNLNSANRGETKVLYKGQYKRVNMDKVKSASDLAYSEILKVCF